MTDETRGEFLTRNDRLNAEKEKDALVEMKSTQEKRPWRTSLRTAVQMLIGLAVVLPFVVPVLIEELGGYMPGWLVIGLGGVAAFVVAVSTAVTRLMAVPAVNEFLRKWLPLLAAEPKE